MALGIALLFALLVLARMVLSLVRQIFFGFGVILPGAIILVGFGVSGVLVRACATAQ